MDGRAGCLITEVGWLAAYSDLDRESNKEPNWKKLRNEGEPRITSHRIEKVNLNLNNSCLLQLYTAERMDGYNRDREVPLKCDRMQCDLTRLPLLYCVSVTMEGGHGAYHSVVVTDEEEEEDRPVAGMPTLCRVKRVVDG